MNNRLSFDEDAVSNLYLDDGHLFFNVIPVIQEIDNDSIDVQRSAAIIANASDESVEIFRDFVPDLIEILQENAHRSASRIAFRVLEKLPNIPEKHLGNLVDLAFKYLNTPTTSIAEKVFAMTVIANQIAHYPDLKYELEASLAAQIKTGSAGFKNRAGKIASRYGLKL
jgi:hypothetical protein